MFQESICPEKTLRICGMIRIVTESIRVEGTFSFDAAQLAFLTAQNGMHFTMVIKTYCQIHSTLLTLPKGKHANNEKSTQLGFQFKFRNYIILYFVMNTCPPSLFETMDLSKNKDERLHLGYSGLKIIKLCGRLINIQAGSYLLS